MADRDLKLILAAIIVCMVLFLVGISLIFRDGRVGSTNLWSSSAFNLGRVTCGCIEGVPEAIHPEGDLLEEYSEDLVCLVGPPEGL
jgi:hypothetical protein